MRNPNACMASGSNGGTVDINASIKATHASWLVDNWAFTTTLNGSERERTVQASAETGYDLAVARWRVRNGEVEVQIANNGVAPFYYNWNVEAVAIQHLQRHGGRAHHAQRRPAQGRGRQVPDLLRAGSRRPGRTEHDPGARGQPVGVGPAAAGFSSAGQDQTLPGYLTLGRTPTK